MTSTRYKPTVRILHHLARTGGTLISRCLGSMTNVLLLSEIHPDGSASRKFNLSVQAHQWFNLFTAEDIAMARQNPNMGFADVIELVSRRCTERNRVLVIRDWTHLDFTGAPFVKPSYRLATAESLQERFEVIHTTTVRHPVDQWLSIDKLPVFHGRLLLDDFLRGYRLFAEHCVRIGFIRYEDFVRSPEQKMHELCKRLSIKYDRGFLDRWSSYTWVTGDTGELALKNAEIKAVPRKPVAPDLLRKFEDNPDYQASLVLLSYSHPD